MRYIKCINKIVALFNDDFFDDDEKLNMIIKWLKYYKFLK